MRTHQFPRPARGFSLAELMVTLAIGLLVMAGLTTLFVRNTKVQGEVEKANRQVENGRFAIDMMTADLRNAGYYGEFDPTVLPAPTTLPAPCDASVAALNAGLALPVQGVDNGGLDCLPDQKPDTDVLVVRRTSTCVAGDAGCDGVVTGLPYFQASLCSNASELNGSATDRYRLDTDASKLDRHQRNCTATAGTGTPAVKRRYLTHIYYIANNNASGDGIPTLKRAELDLKGGTLDFNVVPLAEGIENLQVEYGLDLDSTPTTSPAATPPGPDGVADTFTPVPSSANGCTAEDCAVTNWQSAVAVKLHVLAVNPDPSPGFIDNKTYVLGHGADGNPVRITPDKDARKRHVFETMVTLPNLAGRRQ